MVVGATIFVCFYYYLLSFVFHLSKEYILAFFVKYFGKANKVQM